MVKNWGISQPDEFFAGERNSEGLASLACSAAHELDEHHLGKAKSYEYVEHLARIMPPALANRQRLIPSTALVLNAALKRHTGEDYRKIDEVVERTVEFARRLRNARTASREEAADLRGYCLALSKAFCADADKDLPAYFLMVA